MNKKQKLLLDNAGLPKWPQMAVTGMDVTEEQAKEIIRRTDNFFKYGGGNNREWNKFVRDSLGMPPDGPELWDLPVDERFKIFPLKESWRKQWGIVDTQYVENSWISCNFIGGPHGWVWPDGHIGYTDNVGKWPSAEEVFKDWKAIAEAFPFLNLGITLMSSEEGEENCQPVISFSVKDGIVEVFSPSEKDVHESHPTSHILKDGGVERFLKRYNNRNYSSPNYSDFEIGIPKSWIDDWAKLNK